MIIEPSPQLTVPIMYAPILMGSLRDMKACDGMCTRAPFLHLLNKHRWIIQQPISQWSRICSDWRWVAFLTCQLMQDNLPSSTGTYTVHTFWTASASLWLDSSVLITTFWVALDQIKSPLYHHTISPLYSCRHIPMSYVDTLQHNLPDNRLTCCISVNFIKNETPTVCGRTADFNWYLLHDFARNVVYWLIPTHVRARYMLHTRPCQALLFPFIAFT
jgi:hypothetical protein